MLTQSLLYSLQISIFVIPSNAPQAVQKELKSEKEDQIKVMQTPDQLCIHIQTHFFSPYIAPLHYLRVRATESHGVMTRGSGFVRKGRDWGYRHLGSLSLVYVVPPHNHR